MMDMDTKFFMSPKSCARDIKLKICIGEELEDKELIAYNLFKKILTKSIYSDLVIEFKGKIILSRKNKESNIWFMHKELLDICENELGIGLYRGLKLTECMVEIISDKIIISELSQYRPPVPPTPPIRNLPNFNP